jgi:hypothetical protein
MLSARSIQVTLPVVVEKPRWKKKTPDISIFWNFFGPDLG